MQISSWVRIVLALIGSVLFLDGAILIAFKKIHIGTVLPLLLGLFFCLYAYFYYHIERFFFYHFRLHSIWRFGWLCFWIWVISLGYFFDYLSHNNTQAQTISPVKAIIVLGSGIENGQPSATLAKRLDRAAPIALAQPQAKLVMTGGIDFGETQSEAIIMSNYVQQRYQIPASQIILEDKSTSTELNLKNSQQLLQAQQISIQQPIAIVTSDFHTLRAAAIAKKQGYRNITMLGATTPLATRYNAWLREYFAYASGWLLNEY
ncbi:MULTISPECIES: YdcF family protein [Acinetobacter]|uniref:YdcF family protein n=1 Tax=Acinetobacter genomosp. 15BJ TaxID=106651 RepID=A0ABT8UWQ8_9GAMM|nr:MULTISPECIES: YdcF family protein [Acinetobacter]MCI3879948.1 YdcF family protein [Acinetobacter higginsii]MDO3656852.1 YdcF family protein [Acinetobacter genomosp. 15BJ]